MPCYSESELRILYSAAANEFSEALDEASTVQVKHTPASNPRISKSLLGLSQLMRMSLKTASSPDVHSNWLVHSH